MATGLPEVIYTSAGDRYLHIPGVIVSESSTSEMRYLLADGLGSVRQAVDSLGEVTVYHEFDPYGSPVENGGDPYGFTGEWWEEDVELLHLRARRYAPEVGVFLSRDPVESEPPYQYVRGNPVNLTDPSGNSPECQSQECKLELMSREVRGASRWRHLLILFSDTNGTPQTIEGFPSKANTIMALASDPNDQGQLNEVWYALDNWRNGAEGAIFITLIEGDIACNKWECLKNKMAIITVMDIPYIATSHSSNSAVYTALKACGISLSWSEVAQEKRWNTKHPGWGTYLFFSGPRPRLAPTPPPIGTPTPTGTPTPIGTPIPQPE